MLTTNQTGDLGLQRTYNYHLANTDPMIMYTHTSAIYLMNLAQLLYQRQQGKEKLDSKVNKEHMCENCNQNINKLKPANKVLKI